MTTVSQEAREAAAALIDKHGRSKDWTPTNIRLGNLDDLPTVQAFAKFERDTLARHRLERSEPVGWMGIESAPVDEQILAAIKVNHRNGDTWWERHIIVIDSETGTISDMDYHHGWEANDYEFWQPLPSAPGTTTPEPVAEIERLREAAERCIQIVERYNHRQNEKVEDVKLILRQALKDTTHD